MFVLFIQQCCSQTEKLPLNLFISEYSTILVNVIILQSGNVGMPRLMENFQQHNNWILTNTC